MKKMNTFKKAILCSLAVLPLANAALADVLVETTVICQGSAGDKLELLTEQQAKVGAIVSVVDGVYVLEASQHRDLLTACRTFLNGQALSLGERTLLSHDGMMIVSSEELAAIKAAKDAPVGGSSFNLRKFEEQRRALLERKIAELEARLDKKVPFGERVKSTLKSAARYSALIAFTAFVTSVWKDGGDTKPTFNAVGGFLAQGLQVAKSGLASLLSRPADAAGAAAAVNQ